MTIFEYIAQNLNYLLIVIIALLIIIEFSLVKYLILLKVENKNDEKLNKNIKEDKQG
ncbi:MAG: hypothetical protein IKW33_03045 [Clostridia bacterium]|nr:hypothetical protein [Clostridia bacterium]